MNYFINEFRGPLTFAVLRFTRCPSQQSAMRDLRFDRTSVSGTDPKDTSCPCRVDGSALQLLGLSLIHAGSSITRAWKRSLENLVERRARFLKPAQSAGFLAPKPTAASGTEYTGLIGIPDIAVTDKPLITHAPSLYTLGAAYTIAPRESGAVSSGALAHDLGAVTPHGPWEGFDISNKTGHSLPDNGAHPVAEFWSVQLPPGKHASLSRRKKSLWATRSTLHTRRPSKPPGRRESDCTPGPRISH